MSELLGHTFIPSPRNARGLKGFGNAQFPHHELVDLESPDSRTPNHKSTNGKCTDRNGTQDQGSDGHGSERPGICLWHS